MSAPVQQKPEYILIVNEENKDTIAAALPGIAFAQVLAYDIGIVDRIILSVPRQQPAPVPVESVEAVEASPEVPSEKSWE